ncbi:MAG: ATP-binding protein [Pseudonocardia sp.]|nr:ATP-binding protein [Pseudonocardia sp.]
MPPELNVEFTAERHSAARSRRATTDWLASVCRFAVCCDTGQDIVLAVNEAVSNGIEHAYPDDDGVVTVCGRIQEADPDRRPDGACPCGALEVCIEVSDHGCWQTPPADPGHRGRGLMMAEGAVDLLTLDTGTDGTVVTLHRRLGCRALAAP